MKKIIVMLSLGVLVAGSSYAQTTPQKDKKERTEQRGAKKGYAKGDKAKKSPEERAQLRTEKMSERYELNASQKNQLQALNMRQAKEKQSMRANYKGAEDKSQMRDTMKANHAKWQAELKGILTAQQFAKYEADREEMRSKMENRKGKGDWKGKESRSQRS
jgi:periplasmic protein CpxP/Spy